MFGILTMKAQTASGYVYADSNKNGRKDKNELGIREVAVTNGIKVVLTNEAGKYQLPVNDDAIIAVIKPTGYMLPKNVNNIPQFYYIHKPKGSPTSKFKGVAPTGRLPESIDFALIPTEEKDDFKVLVFGDPQPYTQEEVDFFEKGIVSEVENLKNVQFGMSLGDLVGNDLSLFDPYMKAVKKVGIPWFNVMGNHDMNFDATEDKLSDETYEAHFGPANYAFNYGKVHFILLDNILYPDPRDSKSYWGGFSKDQLEFIENDLKFVPKDHLIVLAFHIPLSEPWGDNFRDEDRNELFRLLKDYPHTLSLSAHTHIQRQDFLGKESGWLQDEPHHEYNVGTTSGDWYSGTLNEQGIPVSTMRDGTPKGYAFFEFSGNEYRFRYKVAGKPDDYQMKIFAPKVVATGKRARSGIFVNFFIGRPEDTVEYRIDEGKWKKMEYVNEPDPSYLAKLYKWDLSEELLSGRRSSNAIDSKHLWRGNIPTNLKTGEHSVEIKARDMFGNEYFGKSSYRLEDPKS